MKVLVTLKRRDGKAEAKGIYEDGKLTVKKGSLLHVNSTSKLNLESIAQKLRVDKSIVGKDGVLKKDVTFNSASTAANFVTGTSTNGMITWKTQEGKKLSEIVKK